VLIEPSSAQETELYSGPAVRADVAASPEAVLVAMVHAGPRPFVRLLLVPMNAGAPSGAPRQIDVPRRGAEQYLPDAVVACAEPGGFAVLWQELSVSDGTAARTSLARVTSAGQWTAEPRVVEVPWALGAMAWNGSGYTLAVYYTLGSPDQTRICGVTLSPAGQPQQHPWWASPAERIGEVVLVVASGGMTAVYRGGPAGQDLRAIDLGQPRSWGVEPPSPASRGPIGPGEVFGVRPTGQAGFEVVVR